MSDEKIKLWFEMQKGDEDAKGLGFEVEENATEEQIRDVFKTAADATVRAIGRERSLHVPPAVKVSL